MPKLIVNADDLGCGHPRDRGICEAFREGIVTSASILANGPSFAEAAELACATGLPTGVHLNLSEWRALGGPIEGLTDASGAFPGKTGLRRVLTEGRIAPESLQRELAAQVERVLEAGLRPDHLDTHQHCGLFPVVTDIVLGLAQRFGIKAVRNCLPAEPAAHDPAGPLGKELALYRRLAPQARAKALEAGLFSPQGIWGAPLLNRLETEALRALLGALPAGCWELMVHPGYPDPAHPFSGPERQRELVALTSPEIIELIGARGIQLTTFGECTCAS